MQKLNRNETELGILSYSVVKVVRLKGVPASGKANPGRTIHGIPSFIYF